MEGTTVGNWKLDAPLGEGGMGMVYRAHHMALGTAAAVKVLSESLTHAADMHQRFFQEARTQAQLNHPHIVRVLDYLEHDGRWFLVTEYVENGSLERLLERRAQPLEIERAVDWTMQALEALDFAHRQGVIHRDVKPSNILLDARDRVKVTDFGIAVVLGGRRLTRTGVSLGTPQYMSPEQIRRPREVDHRTDVYSVGLVLYELLAGRVPFDSDSEFDVQFAQVNQEPARLRELNPAIPQALEEIVATALAKEPDQRFSGCGAFARALEGVRNGGQTKGAPSDAAATESASQAPETQPIEQARAKDKRDGAKGRWLWALGGGMALSLLALISSCNETVEARREAGREEGLRLSAERQRRELEVRLEENEALLTAANERAVQGESRLTNLAVLADARSWPIVIADSFDTNYHEWSTGHSTDAYAVMNQNFVGGRYLWQATSRQRFVGYSKLHAPGLTGFFAGVDTEIKRCTSGCRVGLAFRSSGTSRYLFRIEGAMVAVHLLENDEWTALFDWSHSTAVRPGTTNRLEVIASGSDFLFFVNGQKVAGVTDRKLTSGGVQLASGIFQGNSESETAFDNFEVRRRPAAGLGSASRR